MEEFDRWPSFDFCSISQKRALFYIVVDRLHRNLVYRLKTEICLEFNVKLIGNRTLVSLGITLAVAVVCGVSDVGYANPYLAKPGEPVAKVRIGTCAVTGGFNVIYNLNDLGFPFIYSSLFTNSRTLKERPAVVQKVVAALAESVHFVERNPEPAMASVGKILRIKDADTLRSAYDAYAKNLINRRMTVPAKMVAETLEIAREDGAVLRRKPKEIFDNTFVDDLETSGFMRELWGGALPAEKKRP
jgi:hypothetical protein